MKAGRTQLKVRPTVVCGSDVRRKTFKHTSDGKQLNLPLPSYSLFFTSGKNDGPFKSNRLNLI